MLAASPSHSPTTFRVGAFHNGSGPLPMYQSPSRNSTPPSHKLPKSSPAGGPAAPSSPPLRANYQHASTQYSPMGDALRTSPLLPPANTGDRQTRSTAPSIPLTGSGAAIVPSQQITTASSVPLLTASPRPHSPRTKRRQFKETAESGSSATAQPIAPKRTRSAKAAAKVLPVRYELCAVEDMVILIADMISELIETNDNLPLRDVVLTRFHSRTPPGISVIDYLQRLAKHATLSPPLLLSMVYYIDRLCSLYPAFSITSLTVHRFLITAATVSAKGLSDSFWNNSTYARVGGIKLAELGLLELEFLYRLDWRIVPNPEVLVDYYRGLVGRTEDYVLESEIGSGSVMSEGVEGEAKLTGDPKALAHVNDTKWDKWMKDVADSTVIKKDDGAVP